jgi:uncharacterized membrane protein
MRHPLHAALVHFPMALLGTSLAFDGAGLVTGAPTWWTISFWNLALGLALGLLAGVTGFIDSLRVPEDAPAAPVVARHMLVVLAGLSCYGLALVVRGGTGAPVGTARVGTLALEALGLVSLLVAGWLGGELVYRHGVGQLEERRRAACK